MADQLFAHLVYFALPPVLLYLLIYGIFSPWKDSWIGRSLFFSWLGLSIMLTFSALYQLFGPNYWGRDGIRIGGMAVACVGFYLTLFSLIQVKLEDRRNSRQDCIHD